MTTAVMDKIGNFLEQVAAAKTSAILADYDGTLSPLQVDRHSAMPYAGVNEQLCDLITSGVRVVIVSGRAIQDIQRFLPIDGIEIWGSHCAERRDAHGTYSQLLSASLGREFEPVLAALELEGLSAETEVKPFCVAVHWRGMSSAEMAEACAAAKRAMAPFVGRHWTLCRFDGGIELRPAKVSKALAVNYVLSELPDAPVAYLGDDLTDEDAFQELGCRGLSVLVRPEYRKTCARLWLRPPEEVLSFLSAWSTFSAAARGAL